jgi:hypothetical protein
LLTIPDTSHAVQELAELPGRDRLGRVPADGATTFLNMREGQILSLQPFQVGAVKGNGLCRGFRPKGRWRLESSGQRVGSADGAILSPLTAAGMKEQVVELPTAQGRIGIFNRGTIGGDRANGAGVDQQPE